MRFFFEQMGSELSYIYVGGLFSTSQKKSRLLPTPPKADEHQTLSRGLEAHRIGPNGRWL